MVDMSTGTLGKMACAPARLGGTEKDDQGNDSRA